MPLLLPAQLCLFNASIFKAPHIFNRNPKYAALQTLTHSPQNLLPNRPLRSPPRFLRSCREASSLGHSQFPLSRNWLKGHLITAFIRSGRNAASDQLELEAEADETRGAEGDTYAALADEAGNLSEQGLWNQMKENAKFAGPATGLWVCGPLMSLINTAVIGQGSSIELAALGPGTVICDYMGYWFMFLSIATSNMIATSLAGQNKNEVQHQILMLLFIGLACGFLMLFFTKFFGLSALTAFIGPKNLHIVPAANTYIQFMFLISRFACPAVMIGCVAQSASLGMKDAWGPLKALAVATAMNGIGDIVLCMVLHYGIAGAAWATMISQVVAAYMMILIASLKDKGYKAFALSVPSASELSSILRIAAPVFVTKTSRVAFYALLVYFATSMGTTSVAAHQVMIQTYSMGTVWGEPLSQTAQSFMPELIFGAKRSLVKARALFKSLFVIGAILGLIVATTGTIVLWSVPNIFTSDPEVIREMHKVLIPFFIALSVTPPVQSLEGTLLAGRDLKFISASMSGVFTLGALLLLERAWLDLCWFAVSGFRWARFLLAFRRLSSPNSILYSEDQSDNKLKKLKTT